MNTLQTALAWFGAYIALGCIALAAWIRIGTALKGHGRRHHTTEKENGR